MTGRLDEWVDGRVGGWMDDCSCVNGVVCSDELDLTGEGCTCLN